jgi:hypothetical protein
MSESLKGILGWRDATSEEIRQALALATKAALLAHKRAGVPAVMWDQVNDRIVEVPPEEIEVDDESAERTESEGPNGAHA